MRNLHRRRFVWAPLMAAVLALAACDDKKETEALPPPPPEDGFYLRDVAFDTLPGWAADDQAAALAALRISCARIEKRAPDAPFYTHALYAGITSDWQAVCRTMPVQDADARAFFESQFLPYEIWADPRYAETREGLFTGYYEPTLNAASETTLHPTPLYARPDDMLTINLGDFRPELKGESITGRVKGTQVVPYHTRAEIEAGALIGRAEVLALVDDPVDAFFLHIQGSGQVVHPDGTVERIGYAAQNGHKYVAIGRELIAEGLMAKEDVSMQSIRAWLEQHPDKAADLMNKNPSFIFFQRLADNGPLGAEGVVLTPNRSLAVDRRRIPYGAPVFIDAAPPEGDVRIQQLMIAQDTGGAIRGAVRGDFFWGAGDEAAHKAGLMKSRGHAWLLLPRGLTLPDDVRWKADMPDAQQDAQNAKDTPATPLQVKE